MRALSFLKMIFAAFICYSLNAAARPRNRNASWYCAI